MPHISKISTIHKIIHNFSFKRFIHFPIMFFYLIHRNIMEWRNLTGTLGCKATCMASSVKNEHRVQSIAYRAQNTESGTREWVQSIADRAQSIAYKAQSTEHSLQSIAYRAQSTEHSLQSIAYKHRVQSIAYGAQSTEHSLQSTEYRTSDWADSTEYRA